MVTRWPHDKGVFDTMANPLLNDRALERAQPGWAAPAAPSNSWPAPGDATTRTTDGPVSHYEGAMTVSGTITASAVLFTLLLVSAVFGWNATETNPTTNELSFPGIAFVGIAVGFACVIALYFRPQWAKVLGPVYALAQGFFVGAISRAYDNFQSGVVLQAVGATVATFLVMLVLYRTQIIKVTNRFRKVVIAATLGIMVMYLVSFAFRLFAGSDSVSFLREPNALGIGISVVICVVAALNLALDFDFIERGTKSGLPKHFEWFAAFGLLVTIVWLYLEFLRLLAMLQSRN
ncbi:MAG: Bax inhibitor-1/YccA family protein [Acidimicrobiia bacterium]|nr:Bax inhibitor-1/YccA family protein [Acidimicrobiia bacterium]